MRSARRARSELCLQPLSRELLDGLPAFDLEREGGEDDGLEATSEPVTAVEADVCLLPWFEDERPLSGLLGLFDWRRSGTLSTLARDGVATGRWDESVLLPAGPTLPASRLVLLGCGRRERFDEAAAEEIGRRAVRVAAGLRPQSVVLALPTAVADRDVIESLFLGVLQQLDARGNDPAEVMTTPAHRWWVVVEERYIARLRRLFDGPLRAAVESSSSS